MCCRAYRRHIPSDRNRQQFLLQPCLLPSWCTHALQRQPFRHKLYIYANGCHRHMSSLYLPYEQALRYKQHDLKRFVQVVNETVYVKLNQNQFDALVCLAYNIGAQAFRQSSLVKNLNTGDYESAAEQFLVWNKSRGQVLNGLVRRRAQERQLFLS